MQNQLRIKKHSLSNGMGLLAISSKQAPVVALQGWIRFGAADESEDVAGLAHLFEHLLFKGTEKRAVGQIANEIESLGGDLNAYTSYDQTVMHMTLPSKALTQGLDILSDSLLHSIVDPDELAREKPVILEEIKRRNDMPGSIASDLLRSELFSGHPYARPVIGYANVVDAMPRESILEQYHRHYNAKNVFLVIAGDFEEAALKDMCENYFSSMKPGAALGPRPLAKKIKGSHSHFKHHPSPDALMSFGWRAPNALDDSVAALDALALVIGQGESSRLVRRLVYDQRLVREIGAGCWTPKDSGSFMISLKGPKGTSKNYDKIVRSIHEAIRPPISSAELEKAKKNLLASATYSKETVDGLAQRFGYYECIASDFALDEKYLEQVAALKISDLERVKHEFLDWNNTIAAGIVPKGDVLPSFKVPTSIQARSASPRVTTEETSVKRINYKGLTVLLKHIPGLPIFCLRWVGLGGGRLESAKQIGLGTLWARMVTNGGVAADSKLWTRDRVDEFVDRNSASLGAFHGRNSFGFQLDGLSDDFEILGNLLMAVRNAPTFDSKELKIEKAHLLTDIRSLEDSPGNLVSRILMENLFKGHSYGRSSLGTAKSLSVLSAAHLKAYHKTLLKEPQVLTLVGDVSEERLLALLDDTCNQSAFPKHSALQKQKFTPRFPTKSILKRQVLKKEQTHILIGFPSCPVSHKDRWPLLGLSAVLSGQGGRLFAELRDKMSLCYTVSPTHMEGLDGGYFGFYIATSPEKEALAIAALKKEINRVIDDGISDAEWKKAAEFYIGNHLIEQQRYSSQAMGMALDEVYDFGFDEYFAFETHLRSVSAEDLRYVAKKYLGKNAVSVTAVVGPNL